MTEEAKVIHKIIYNVYNEDNKDEILGSISVADTCKGDNIVIPKLVDGSYINFQFTKFVNYNGITYEYDLLTSKSDFSFLKELCDEDQFDLYIKLTV